MQLAHQLRCLIFWNGQGVDFSGIPFGDRAIDRQKVWPCQIKRQSLIALADCFVTPMIRRRLFTNSATEDRQRIALITIATDNSARRITGAEENGERQYSACPSQIPRAMFLVT